jgi:type II secretory pathway pseudopilin PulG
MRHSRGFTLVEVILTVLLVLMVITLGVPQMKGAKEKAESKSLAMILAEEMRLARGRAMNRQVPVAVVFPSDGGANPQSRSCYILEGETNPRITRVIDFSKDYPSACLFLGWWNLADAALRNTLDQPNSAANWDDFSLDGWAPRPGDFIFLFTPSGTVKTNGLPNFDRTFHVVVSKGAECKTGGLGAFSRLRKVCDPFTVSISPLGEISVTEGVMCALTGEGGVELLSSPLDGGVAALPPAASSGANRDPVIERPVDVLPKSNPETLPSGVNATVSADGYLTLTVRATDPDGDVLYCTWEDRSTVKGFFSIVGEARMEWNSASGKWVSVTEWRPPLGAVEGNTFTLVCTVEDKRGGRATTLNEPLVAGIVGGGKIVLETTRRGDYEIYAMNESGTRIMDLTNHPSGDEHPFCSPDGTKIAYVTHRDGAFYEIYLMNSDGSGQTRLTYDRVNNNKPSWSPDGTKILFQTNRHGNKWDIYVMNADGEDQNRLTNNQDEDNKSPY